jgi:hypothetical protein
MSHEFLCQVFLVQETQSFPTFHCFVSNNSIKGRGETESISQIQPNFNFSTLTRRRECLLIRGYFDCKYILQTFSPSFSVITLETSIVQYIPLTAKMI